MPRHATDYSKTIVYKLACLNPEITDCYIGHTTDFSTRKRRHKCNCNNETCRAYSYPVYKFIREHGGWDNWKMIMLEQCDFGNSLEASARERHWFEQIRPTLNTQTPNEGGGAEWRKNHVEHISAYNKQYYELKNALMQI